MNLIRFYRYFPVKHIILRKFQIGLHTDGYRLCTEHLKIHENRIRGGLKHTNPLPQLPLHLFPVGLRAYIRTLPGFPRISQVNFQGSGAELVSQELETICPDSDPDLRGRRIHKDPVFRHVGIGDIKIYRMRVGFGKPADEPGTKGTGEEYKEDPYFPMSNPGFQFFDQGSGFEKKPGK
jgi:hypothetical protein